MKIQIIIPILNPEASFFSDIIPLINSDGPISAGEYEVITIDKKKFNHANTRNIALEYPSDLYLFMTQDAQPYDEILIEKMVKALEALGSDPIKRNDQEIFFKTIIPSRKMKKIYKDEV